MVASFFSLQQMRKKAFVETLQAFLFALNSLWVIFLDRLQEELEDARVKSRISKQRNITMKQIKGRNEKELLEQSVCEAAEWRMAEACDNVARQKAAKKIRPKVKKIVKKVDCALNLP